jgi:CBS domain-containing protein
VGHKRNQYIQGVRADPSPRIEATAGEVMTTPAIVCRETTTLEELAELLSNREVSGVPVVAETGEVVGVVSEADFARAVGVPLIRLALKPRRSGPWLRVASRPHATQARDVMSSPPKVVSPDTPLHSVAEVMVTEGINRVPVVDEGRLLGVVTRSDLLAALAFMDQRVARSHEAPIVLGPRALTRDEGHLNPSPERAER